MKKEKQIIYYSDELKDEFSEAKITPRVIDGTFNYEYDTHWRHFKAVLSRVIAYPIAMLFLCLKYHHKVVNGRVFRQMKKQGFFLYGNHTNDVADALIPSIITRPRSMSVIVHPNNVSMPFLGRITPYLGGMPLPDDRMAMKHFMKAISKRVQEGKAVMIYPEAHIWPFYTHIRPFTDASFHYPVHEKVPVLCFTNTYQKRRFSHTPKIVTYVDGPFYSNKNLSDQEQRKELRDCVYETMVQRSKNSNVELIQYVKKEGKPSQ